MKKIFIMWRVNRSYSTWFHLKKLKDWTPNLLVDNNDKLSKLIILGPSRSGKSLLELTLAKSNKVKPFFDEIRYHCDKLELMVDDEIWPLTKYRELLFTK